MERPWRNSRTDINPCQISWRSTRRNVGGGHRLRCANRIARLARLAGVKAQIEAQKQELQAMVDAKKAEAEQKINDELLAVQGSPADIGGYFRPDDAKVKQVMRPSTTFSEVLRILA